MPKPIRHRTTYTWTLKTRTPNKVLTFTSQYNALSGNEERALRFAKHKIKEWTAQGLTVLGETFRVIVWCDKHGEPLLIKPLFVTRSMMPRPDAYKRQLPIRLPAPGEHFSNRGT